jgi:hypothetical protein
VQGIRSSNGNSGYSVCVLSTGCTYGSIIDTMNLIKIERKGKYFYTIEKIPYI